MDPAEAVGAVDRSPNAESQGRGASAAQESEGREHATRVPEVTLTPEPCTLNPEP